MHCALLSRWAAFHRHAVTALAAALLLSWGSLPGAAKGVCKGSDMLQEIKVTEPAIFERITEEAKKVANTEALLWKIEKQGVAPSHLFGTVHLTDDRVAALSPKVKAALQGARTLALEVEDLSATASAAAIGEAAPLVLYTDGQRLDKHLSREEFATVKSTLSKAGMPGEVAAMFRPWIVYMILSVSECERRKVQEGALVLDMKLAEVAKARKIPIVGLETIKGQLTAMAAVPEHQQIQILKATLKYADRIDDSLETVLQLYMKRNMGAVWPFQMALAAKAGIDPTMFDGFMRELVVKRNKNMQIAALPLLETGNAFIGVGALHLPGKTGLVELLREAGYTLTPVE